MRLQVILDAMNKLAPLNAAENWDNVGLLAGDVDQDVTQVMLTIDYTDDVAKEAMAAGCQAVLCYHPPIFQGLKRVNSGSLIYDAIRRGVALYSFHTALDVVEGGTNDMLADALGLLDRVPMRPLPVDAKRGAGRMGTLKPIERSVLVQQVKTTLGLQHVMVAGPMSGVVDKAACCAGACGDLLDVALSAKVGLYLTGELRHHDALKAASQGVTVVCTLHSNSERAVLPRLREKLATELSGLQVLISQQDRDPFAWH